ncbi:MAG: AraC family transcriptional regulator [Eubacteriales bacterium]|nr:AraC family transcriptional regulator [Eubacteriales bacterium]
MTTSTQQLTEMSSFGHYEKTGYLNESYRLFHIKDQTEKAYSYHFHDFHKVIVFLSGKVTYHIEGKAYPLQPGDILLVSRHAIHKPEIDSSVPYERIILWIRDDIDRSDLIRCFAKANDRSFNLVRLYDEIGEDLQKLLKNLRKAEQDTAFGADLLKDALFTQFMVYLNRIFLNKEYIVDQHIYHSDSQIDQILSYINQNLSDDLSIERLSQKFYISRYYMMRKFKAETGYTVHSYVQNKRLLWAQQLIAQKIPVTKAALQCGFHDYSTFERAYKKQFGHKPTATENDKK